MILVVVSLVGAALFAWPLLGIAAPPALPALAAVCVAVIVLASTELATRRLDSRGLALLVTIAAVDAALRLALVTGIAGFSPIFFLILCAGYVFGPTYGFLCGTTSLLVSGIVTGGVGVWLPYEMLAAGWCGAAAGLCGTRRRGAAITTRDLVVLAIVGAITGFAYGGVMDIWDWALRRGSPDIGWMPGIGAAAEIGRFGHFYVITSLAWDTFRAVGNAVLVVAAGRPVMLALLRLRRRFGFVDEGEVVPA